MRSRLRIRRWCCLAPAVVVLVAGCGDGQATVNGTVTLENVPVASGAVTFVKEGSQPVREGAIIQDGSFEAKLPPGRYKLELTGQKIIGKRTQKGFDGQDEVVELTGELFPERYNVKSELTEEIKPGANVVTLDLKGAK